MTILALAYWNEPGLPDGFEKVGLWGISIGAELALLAGDMIQLLISCVTAVCSRKSTSQSFVKNKGVMLLKFGEEKCIIHYGICVSRFANSTQIPNNRHAHSSFMVYPVITGEGQNLERWVKP